MGCCGCERVGQAGCRGACNHTAVNRPVVDQRRRVVVGQCSIEGDIAACADRRVVERHHYMEAVVHIDRVFGAQDAASVGVAHLDGENVRVGAVGHVLDLQLRGRCAADVAAVNKVAVGLHPLVAQLVQGRVVTVQVGGEFEF